MEAKMDVKPTKLSFEENSAKTTSISMGFSTQKKLKVLANETVVPVGKTHGGREIYAIIDKKMMDKIHDIDRIKKSAMAFLKKHPSLSDTKQAKFNIPLESKVAEKKHTKKVAVVSPAEKYSQRNVDKKVLSLKSNLRRKLDFSSDSSYSSLSEGSFSSRSFTPDFQGNISEDDFENFDFNNSVEVFSECRQKAKELSKKIVFHWPDMNECPRMLVVVYAALNSLKEIDPSNANVNTDLVEQLNVKFDDMKRIFKHVLNKGEFDEEALEFKVLGFVKLMEEIALIAQIPENEFVLDAIVDEEAKEIWLESLGKEDAAGEKKYRQPYQVPFEDFYNMVILDIFPEKKNNAEFKELITSIMNFANEKYISAWTWSQFIEIAGSVEDFRNLVLKNEHNPDFKMDYLQELAAAF
jgi:hypothetical protein